ncbi:hypothetical protein XENOCAPTIV_011628 [Xenoophorus captivus]|uniref:Calponin-homology (CH) domain-containing protein n=1 Tax=Xenoophorus captivus TaxID=1517983 RepID=A0ABV0RC56_9TELE
MEMSGVLFSSRTKSATAGLPSSLSSLSPTSDYAGPLSPGIPGPSHSAGPGRVPSPSLSPIRGSSPGPGQAAFNYNQLEGRFKQLQGSSLKKSVLQKIFQLTDLPLIHLLFKPKECFHLDDFWDVEVIRSCRLRRRLERCQLQSCRIILLLEERTPCLCLECPPPTATVKEWFDPVEVWQSDEREAVQKKTFTKWVNSHLSRVSCRITDLYMDLRDGRMLIKLLEVLSGERLVCNLIKFCCFQPKPTKGRMRIHCLENVDKALQFLKEQRVHLENMGSHDIVDGNHRLTLGLIWTIILRFQVRGGLTFILDT